MHSVHDVALHVGAFASTFAKGRSVNERLSRSLYASDNASIRWYAHDKVSITSANVGAWEPRGSVDCPTPRLWIILTGHFRSFLGTQQSFAKLAHESSAGCYLIVAFVPRQAKDDRRHCLVAD